MIYVWLALQYLSQTSNKTHSVNWPLKCLLLWKGNFINGWTVPTESNAFT